MPEDVKNKLSGKELHVGGEKSNHPYSDKHKKPPKGIKIPLVAGSLARFQALKETTELK